MAVVVFIFVLLLALPIAAEDNPIRIFWPPAPDTARVAYLDEIRCDQLNPKSGLFGKIGRLFAGKSEQESLTFPFDIVARDGSLFMVCQNMAALVEVDRDDRTFKLHRCEKYPFVYPVSLCKSGDDIFITDPEAQAVYRFSKGKVTRFIDQGLIRPTGIAALPEENRLYIIDTGDHRLKVFDFEGRLIKVVPNGDEPEKVLHYPTFAASSGRQIFVNDGLNYRIRGYDPDGNQMVVFGREGDGPGCFARPKGLAIDSDGHIYVVDNIFDNVQIFDDEGRLLLVIGNTGKDAGQFWSPAGIDITNDTIYIADTFNHRIQILLYLGGGE
jgi:hypothetical protein